MKNALVLLLALLVVAQADEPKPSPAAQVLKQIEDWPVGELITLDREIDELLLKRLLTPAPGYVRAFARHPGIKVARILQLGLLQGIKEPRGGGAYFSFETGSHSYNERPDLQLQHSRFHSGFYGSNIGRVVPVEVDGVADVTEKHLPESFALDAREFYKQARAIREEKPAPEQGTVYVIRSVRFGEADVIAAFEVLQTDTYGVTLAWKLLKKSEVGRRR
ncbi:MAG: hypothetical protein ACYTEG_02225 [Planctomycetota bacterium]